MSIVRRSAKLVSSVFKSSFVPEQSVRSVRNAWRLRPCPSPHCAAGLASRQHHLDRCCSQVSGDRKSEETHEVHRPSETFTLDVLVSLLRQENAVDVCVIKVPEQVTYAEYFIVVSGVSPRHLRAMALYAIKVYKFLKKDQDPRVKIEGKDAEDWMCIDFGNMVVHFMLPEAREVYELEKLWTLRSYDEQLKNIPAETLPEDFIYDADATK
ncbi:mitochondrial assembly of ribosomal large subunit protein 1 [Mastacembelus armatus]|uniref:mitochondrial assembly of ribosomal large subunit protein 1 n=1 Tax=Mastacembelus armatus TaxID=205130 RepID=UPI000E4632BC|nr:mitochondrial assembly of ribosomal large subunit protein 1 [Mastacembelus armatus]